MKRTRYAQKLVMDKMGRIDLKSVERLTRRDWANWIADHLDDRGPVIGGPRDDMPHALFHRLVTNSGLQAPSLKRALAAIGMNFDEAFVVRRAMRSGGARVDGVWAHDNAVDELLLLVGRTCAGRYSSRPENVTRFLDVFDPLPNTPAKIPPLITRHESNATNLYARVLQTIIALRLKLRYEFWTNQLAKVPGHCGLCFSGAAINSPFDAIRMLPDVDWTKLTFRERMLSPIAYSFLSRYANCSDVEAALEAAIPNLPPAATATIQDARNLNASQNAYSDQ